MDMQMMKNKAKSSQLRKLIKSMGKRVLDSYDEEEASEKPLMKMSKDRGDSMSDDRMEDDYKDMDMGREEDVPQQSQEDKGVTIEIKHGHIPEKMPRDSDEEEMAEDMDEDAFLSEKKRYFGIQDSPIKTKSMKMMGKTGDAKGMSSKGSIKTSNPPSMPNKSKFRK